MLARHPFPLLQFGIGAAEVGGGTGDLLFQVARLFRHRQLVQLDQIRHLGAQLPPRLEAALETLQPGQDALGAFPVLPQIGLLGLAFQLAQATLYPVPFKDTPRIRRPRCAGR